MHRAFAAWPHAQEPESAEASLLVLLGRLWVAGVEVSWRPFLGTERRRRVALPTYPFERERYWVEAKGRHAIAAGARLTRTPPIFPDSARRRRHE